MQKEILLHIVIEMDKMHTELEDKEITMIYDKAYCDAEERARESKLAEEMLAASAVYDEEDKG